MEFSSARAIEQIVWQMRLADYPRSLNRARIDSLADGAPPIPLDEAESNGVEVNVNDLSLTRLSHDARMQLYQGFNKPGNFFTARTDMGAPTRRTEWGLTVTKNANRYLKRSDLYYQNMLSKLALLVLHGIGPSMWQNTDKWCGTPLEIADVLIPSRTRLTFENLPFFAIWRSYTPFEIRRLTRHPEHNPGWNMPVVNRALKWADEQTAKLYGGTTWSEYWVPEKRGQRFKEDSGLYASDLAQTIDCWDFYYIDDVGKHEGWRRRIVFDADGGFKGWGETYGPDKRMPDTNLVGSKKGDFLYTSGDRVVADDLSQIMHFQFADLSAHAPFTYHGVRSLGRLLYDACHLQNRLRCAFTEAVFETLMMYFRVDSSDSSERALKVSFLNRGEVDPSVHFLRPEERWSPNYQLAELGMNEIKQVIADNSSSYVQNQNLSRDRVEKTKFQVMAEVNAMQTLVSSALQMAYRYQVSEYREIFRRFMKADSEDQDVREFRARCLKQGVPEKLLVPGAWDIEPERIVGGGNKTLEMAIAQQLMEWRAAYAPQAQQEILRTATLAITDDAAQTNVLVPPTAAVSDSKHDAMLAFGALMAGAEVQFTPEQSLIEVGQTLIVELHLAVKRAKATGGMVSSDRLQGMQNVVKAIGRIVGTIAKDKPQKELAKKMANIAGKLANVVKGFGQRLAQQAKAAAQQGGAGKAAELKAKLAATLLTAKVKAETTSKAHAQRTAQREAQFEDEMQQRQREHAQDLQERQDQHVVDIRTKAQQHALELSAQRAKAAVAVQSSKAKAAKPAHEKV